MFFHFSTLPLSFISVTLESALALEAQVDLNVHGRQGTCALSTHFLPFSSPVTSMSDNVLLLSFHRDSVLLPHHHSYVLTSPAKGNCTYITDVNISHPTNPCSSDECNQGIQIQVGQLSTFKSRKVTFM